MTSCPPCPPWPAAAARSPNVARRRRARPRLRPARGRAGRPVDADPGQFPLGPGHLLAGLAEQRHRRPPGQDPAQVRGEAAVHRKADRARHVPGAERDAVAQVDDPFPGLDRAPDLVRARRPRRGQVGAARPGPVGRAHPGVVRRVDVEAGQQRLDVGLLVQGQRGVALLFLPDRGRRGLRLRGRAEAAEAVRREDLRGVRQLTGQPPRRGVLRPGQRRSARRAEQVRAAGRAEQQRSPGEHPGHLAAGLQHVGQVVERVPGGGQRPQPQHRADLHDVAVADRLAAEAHRVGRAHQIGRAGLGGQGQAAADVVVVYMRLGDMGDPHATAPGERGDAVDVPLRVDHDRHAAVVGQVAAVAERRRLDL
jgi:hypothetical protein